MPNYKMGVREQQRIVKLRAIIYKILPDFEAVNDLASAGIEGELREVFNEWLRTATADAITRPVANMALSLGEWTQADVNRWRKWDITQAQWKAMGGDSGRCMACGEGGAALNVDIATPLTGKPILMGTVCRRCVSGMGTFGRDPRLLQRITDYCKDRLARLQDQGIKMPRQPIPPPPEKKAPPEVLPLPSVFEVPKIGDSIPTG